MKIKQTLVYGKIQQGAKTKLSKSTVAFYPILAQLLLVFSAAGADTVIESARWIRGLPAV